MNRNDARKIAETITNKQLLKMLNAAKIGITNWGKVSAVNSGMTIGTTWNILAKNFSINTDYHVIAKKNMIWEFGDFLPDELKPSKKIKSRPLKPVHQEPDFTQTGFPGLEEP